ncbi:MULTISPECIES: nitroreductase family protein [unclassified Mesorhizobium]|uniref:nitroreductase family protein n=1 Tax=unclassified Mesorhizobium TaxID=325217 RepID=UPI001129B00E|nr:MULTISPECIES: nitroreductase family protein [unclassified Mesorhizobium]MBZ9894608.1 nitroreductase family protein [Mesorhizobium sp. BR1-1-6]TPM57468.1 nitroreductase family protein [Mesorhizobium sp. B2-2-4]TPM65729.1 nitroreductase family protein [Mesorhizobium sp. B2-2-1]TPN38362.1 nitroreductase family protein [Mesorhizobium sp. B1-1-6]TPN72054.1 nitroreductase family protein [Mesorhizobium sp. B1-1-3]
MNCINTAATKPATRVVGDADSETGNSENALATNVVIETILSRSATKYYDPAATLTDDQIRQLVRIGTSAPTSFHLQNWRFIAVRSPEAKARLRPIAWNQPAITDAAVTFIVIGKLADASTVPDRLAPVVEAGIMQAQMVPDWERDARRIYDDQPQQDRDEAVRTATFGAAAIIYAARSLGWGSTPMIGFDAEPVHREFELAEDEIPVMLLTVGPERAGNWPQKPRMPVADVLDFA